MISFSLLSHPREEKKVLEQEIELLMKQKNFQALETKLEAYLIKYPYERKYQLSLAKVYLHKPISDLLREDDPFVKEEKRKQIQNQYKKAQAIYSQLVPEWERLFPSERNLGYWYFEWAFTEHLLGNKEKAVSLYKKSASFHEFPKEAFYNLGILFLELGLEKDAEKQLKKYYSKQDSEK